MTEQTLPDQTLTSGLPVRKLVFIALGLLLVIALGIFGMHQLRMSDPYVREVLALDGNVAQGTAIFQLNCAGCHGINGTGKVGPSLENVSARRSQISLIHQITSGDTPPMPKFQASPEEMADLLSYLDEL